MIHNPFAVRTTLWMGVALLPALAAAQQAALPAPELPAAPAAQVAAPKAAALSATEIASRNAAARGGLEAWRKVNTLSLSGTLDAGHARPVDPEKYRPGRGGPTGQAATPKPDSGTLVQVPFRADYKRPHQQRMEIDYNGQTAVQVYDGKAGYKYRPFLNRNDWQPFNDEEARQAAEQQDLDGPLIDYAAKGTKLDVEGVEAVDGKPAYKLRLTLKNGDQRRVWVDAGSFLDVQVDGTRRLDGKPHNVLTVQRDFRTVNGLKVPFEYETSVAQVPGSQKIKVTNVLLNPAVDDSRFKPAGPIAAKPVLRAPRAQRKSGGAHK
jgi:outer membrane lipoprotein-sorting protein